MREGIITNYFYITEIKYSIWWESSKIQAVSLPRQGQIEGKDTSMIIEEFFLFYFILF